MKITGYDILKRAEAMLGYSEGNGFAENNELWAQRGLESVNRILSDLDCPEINRLNDGISAECKTLDAAFCGVAMLLSFLEGDSIKNKWFTDAYNSKRGSVKRRVVLINDRLPTVSG